LVIGTVCLDVIEHAVEKCSQYHTDNFSHDGGDDSDDNFHAFVDVVY